MLQPSPGEGELLALSRIGRSMADQRPEQALETLYREAVGLMPADLFFIGLLPPDSATVELRLLYAAGQPRPTPGVPLIDGQPLADAITRRQTAIVSAPVDLPGLPNGATLRCSIVAPVALADGTLVVLCLASEQEEAYDSRHLLLLELMARQAAHALEIDRLYRQLWSAAGEMRQHEEQLGELTRRLMALEETQRELWATDVHDSLAPLIFTSTMHLETYLDSLEEGAPETELAREALEQLRLAAQETRRVIASMGPTSLDVRGVGRVIRDLAQSYAREEGWELSVVDRLGTSRLGGAVSNALYRIAEEALNNIRDHAETRRVELRLDHVQPDVILTIRDWGRGLPAGSKVKLGVGLFGMRRRLERLSGQLSIANAPGGGVELQVRIPAGASGPAVEEPNNGSSRVRDTQAERV